jgi:hypothetical protein
MEVVWRFHGFLKKTHLERLSEQRSDLGGFLDLTGMIHIVEYGPVQTL